MACFLVVSLHPQKSQNMDALSEKIINLANEMFSLYGLKSVSIDDLCRKMSISKKTFYECFKTKEDLVDAVLEHKDKIVEEQFENILTNTNGNAIDELLTFMSMHRLWASIQLGKHPAMLHDLQKYYNTVWNKSIARKEKRVHDFFIRNITRGIEEKLYRAEVDIDMLCIYFGFNHTLKLFEDISCLKSKKLSHQQIALFIIDILTRYITTPTGWNYLAERLKETKC